MGRNRGNLRVNCSVLIESDVGIPGSLCGGQRGSQGHSRCAQRGLLRGERPGAEHTTLHSQRPGWKHSYLGTQTPGVLQILKFSLTGKTKNIQKHDLIAFKKETTRGI